jgi:hypothetical protein
MAQSYRNRITAAGFVTGMEESRVNTQSIVQKSFVKEGCVNESRSVAWIKDLRISEVPVPQPNPACCYRRRGQVFAERIGSNIRAQHL